jgi:hypothetical protein
MEINGTRQNPYEMSIQESSTTAAPVTLSKPRMEIDGEGNMEQVLMKSDGVMI